MSVIGPRPGLWNQDILTAERDKYNANDVKPGLTGYTIVVCISAIVNFVMNLILIPRIGAVGAALASVVAEVVGAVLQIFYCCVSGELEFKNIFLSVWKYIISGIIMLVSLLLIQEQLGQSVVSLIILIVCGSLIYFSSLMVLRDSFFIENLHSIICIKKKKN